MWLHRNGLNIFNLKTVKKQTKKNMFCWTSSSVGSEPLDGVANMSKSDILRGIITEKLSTAAREILAVVERTIADYEEEVAGFRQEIDRQRRLLELLQPRVKLERRELTPELHSCDVLMEASLEENEHHTQQSDILCPDVKDTVNSGLPVYDNVEEEEVEMPFVQPDTSSTQHEEHLKEPDHQIPMHISIWNSASKPELQECTTCCRRLFHCPLCPTFSPTVRAVIEEHINGHIKNALPFKDKMICRCRLPCRTTGHFHCPVCNMTIIRRGDMARHLLSCQHSSITSQPPLSGLLPTALSKVPRIPLAALSKEPRRPLNVFSPASKPFSESSVEHAYALPSVLNKVHENEMPSLWS